MHVVGPPSVSNAQVVWPSSNGSIMPVSSAPSGTTALNSLIDYIVHKTYHDIVVMADILPGKSDMEKKIDVAHFANRTRQLMIRLLAVVKWSCSVLKVMKCEDIAQLLDQQALLFIDTADKLHTLSNQLVVQARLPNFAVPAAVDVLTTGTYPRLPNAIRNKVIHPDPITSLEKAATLKRLNEIIMHRLVTTKIPLEIADLIIFEGRVKLFVPGEFKASLTLMGEGNDISWRLLKLEFMIRDKESNDSHGLVHGLQIAYIHELVQSRLIGSKNPLQDIYNVVHSFCLSLKIEVLQTQAVRLIQKRWGRLVQIDEYQPGVKVVLSYWRLAPSKEKQGAMTISVYLVSKEDNYRLCVVHKPPLLTDEMDLVQKAMDVNDLSLERLLSDTILVRSLYKLHDLHQLLQKHIKNDSSEISKDQSCLRVPLIRPHRTSEYLSISIDPQTGSFIPSLPLVSQQVLDHMEKSMNEAPVNLLPYIPVLRKILAKEKCKSVIQNLPAVCQENIFLDNKIAHDIGNLSDDIIFIKLKNCNCYYVVVELDDCDVDPTALLYHYYLLSTVAPSAIQASPQNFRADMLMRLDCFSSDILQNSHQQGHLMQQLPQIVSICDARIPFISLSHDIVKEGLSHQGILQEGSGTGLCIKLVTFPEIPAACLEPSLKHTFLSTLLECSFSLVEKSSKMAESSGSKCWHADLVFSKCPLNMSADGDLTQVSLKLDFPGSSSPLAAFKGSWASILHLYGPVFLFAKELENGNSFLNKLVSVSSYDFRTLVLKYGNNRELLVGIKWLEQSEKFMLWFGRCNSTVSNSHSLAVHYLNNLFNTHPDIGKLVQVLHDTSEPLQAICSLSSVPLIGMTFNQSTVTQQNAKSVSDSFAVVVQTVSHFRLVYRSTFCLDIYCLPNKKIALRDGSLSKFQSTEVKEALQPIPGLKSFLSQFELNGGSHLRPSSEKDNPPLVDVQNSLGPVQSDARTIPEGVWAGGNPTVLGQESFTMMLKEQPIANHSVPMSFLEQFMGLTLLRRELERIIHLPAQDAYYFPSPNVMPNVLANDALTTFFAANSLMFKVAMQFLQLRPVLAFNIQQTPPIVLQERGLPHGDWRPNMLQILEQFFKVRVASPPFRPSNVQAFCNIISSKSVILTDFINVMGLELTNPHANDPGVKWLPQICLTVPPRLSYAPSGVPAVYIKDKILIFVLMTMKNHPNPPRQGIIMPIVWYPQTNITTLPGRNNPLLTRIDAHLKQWMERRLSNSEYHMSGAVKYLMDNFTLQ